MSQILKVGDYVRYDASNGTLPPLIGKIVARDERKHYWNVRYHLDILPSQSKYLTKMSNEDAMLYILENNVTKI